MRLERIRELRGLDVDASWRTRDGNDCVNGVSSLLELLTQYSDQFVQTFTEKLLVYALGRAADYHDMPALRSIVRKAAAGDYRFSSIVLDIITSDVFQEHER